MITPGEWVLTKEDFAKESNWWIGTYNWTEEVAHVNGYQPAGEANARLIVQAPKMYDMLKRCKETFEFLAKREPRSGLAAGYVSTARNIRLLLGKADGVNPVPDKA